MKSGLIFRLGGMLFCAMMLVAAASVPAYAGGDAAAGEKAYGDAKKGNCKTCHNLNDKKKVGPGLAGVMTRYPEDFLKKFIKDPAGTWDKGGPEVDALKKHIGKPDAKKATMKVPASMTDQDVDDIVAYLKQAAK